jgi:catechol 2,3-dioxygenase-like lactoylglutathione lyase family enzyme
VAWDVSDSFPWAPLRGKLAAAPLRQHPKDDPMKITLASVSVDDQDKALRFYTEVLGFTPMADIPMGGYRWLTVSSPEGAAGVELVLEPIAFEPARVYQRALFEAGIPSTAFLTDDIHAEVAKLKGRGVQFRGEPQDLGPVTLVMFEDTCGNLLQLAQPAAR